MALVWCFCMGEQVEPHLCAADPGGCEGAPFLKCATCHGSGTVNALTNPDWVPFVASYGTCPSCDGSGEAP